LRRTSILTLTFGAVALSTLSGCHGPANETKPTETGIAATVNGEPISLAEYDEHNGIKHSVQVSGPQGPSQIQVIGTIGLQSMQELVDQKVLMQLAKDQGVAPTEADIDAELKFQTELRPDYVDTLKDEGLNLEQIRSELRIGLAREHVIVKGVVVKPTEVDDYIKKHQDRFIEPARATVFYIQLPSPAREADLDKELASGKSFNDVASEFGQKPNGKGFGGLYRISVISSMPKEIQDAVNKTDAKHVTGWLHIGQSFFKFYVEAKSPSKPKVLTASERELIRRSLSMIDGQVANHFDSLFYDKLKSSKVEIMVPYLKSPWQRSWSQLSEPMSPQAPPTSPSGSGKPSLRRS